LAKVSQLKRVPQISSLSEAVVTHLLHNLAKYALFICFLEYNKVLKTRKLALSLWSIVHVATAAKINDDRKSKGEEPYRASAVIYTYRYLSWVVALKRPSGSSVKLLFLSRLEKQETKQ